MVRNCHTDSQETAFHSSCESYDFELADFQKYAITGIEENKNILITAHTGSGKTLPAEHAIKKYCSDTSSSRKRSFTLLQLKPYLIKNSRILPRSFQKSHLEFSLVISNQIRRQIV